MRGNGKATPLSPTFPLGLHPSPKLSKSKNRRLFFVVAAALLISAVLVLHEHAETITFEDRNAGQNHEGNIGPLQQLYPSTVSSKEGGETSQRALPMHFITVQTGPSPPWCRMLLSGRLTGNVTVHNLAWGAKYAHIKRPHWILEFLRTVENSDVVLFADGGDTIFTGVSKESIYTAFSNRTASSEATYSTDDVRHGRSLAPVLFNAEANCYHQQTFDGSWGVKKGKCLAAYKRYDSNVTSPYRYLNGGAWIARVWAAKRVFTRAQEIIRRNSKLWCDQSVLGGILLSGEFRHLLDLDRDNRFFLPTYHLRPSRDFCDDAVHSALPRMRMCHSGQTPAVVHFNGKSEGRFTTDVLRRSSWAQRLQNISDTAKRSLVAIEKEHAITYLWSSGKSSPHFLKDLCPSDAFPV